MTGRLLDACPVCHPGDQQAAFPVSATVTDGGVTASYECDHCGARWRTWWCSDGWPAARVLEPVTPQQAAVNRALLAEALEEGDRERAYSAAPGSAP